MKTIDTALILTFLCATVWGAQEAKPFASARDEFNAAGAVTVRTGTFKGTCLNADGESFGSLLTSASGKKGQVYGFTLGKHYSFTKDQADVGEVTAEEKKGLATNVDWRKADHVHTTLAKVDIIDGTVEYSLFVKQVGRKLVAYSYIVSTSYSLFGGVIGRPTEMHHFCSY